MAIGIERAILLETDGARLGPGRDGRRDRRGDPGPGGRQRPVRPDPVRQRVGRQRRLPGRDPGRRCARPADRHRGQGPRGRRRPDRRPARGPRRRLGVVRAAAAGGRRRSRRGSTCRATRRSPAGCGRRRRRSSGSTPGVAGRAGPRRSSSACRRRSSRRPRSSAAARTRRRRSSTCSTGSGSSTDERTRPRPRRASPAARRTGRSLEALSLARGAGRRARRRRSRRSSSADAGAAGPPPGRSAARASRRRIVVEHRAADASITRRLGGGASPRSSSPRARRPSSAPGTRARQRRPRPRRRPARPADGRERHRRSSPASAWRLTRQRWAGQPARGLLARRADPAAHRRAERGRRPMAADAGAGARRSSRSRRRSTDADLAVARHGPRGADRGRRLARRREGRRRRRPRRRHAEGFADLEELAGLLGGAVGGSRVVTSAGWRPHADQIGQTGLRIAPDLYIACGISGAIQHIVGCKAAKRILAINTDAESPIMSRRRLRGDRRPPRDRAGDLGRDPAARARAGLTGRSRPPGPMGQPPAANTAAQPCTAPQPSRGRCGRADAVSRQAAARASPTATIVLLARNHRATDAEGRVAGPDRSVGQPELSESPGRSAADRSSREPARASAAASSGGRIGFET